MTHAVANPKPDSSTTGRHIPALDGIRGIAILTVLWCHLFWSNSNPAGGHLLRLVAQIRAAGWVGVELFFVLSGFLITGILYDTLPDHHYFRNFYARRILRIFPLYYGFFALLFIITFLRGEHWTSAVWGDLTYTGSLHIKVSVVTNASWININHFWSLMVEEQFYFVWPLLVFLLRTRRRIAILAVSVALSSLLLRIILGHFLPQSHYPFLLYSWTPCCLDGLAMGALLSMVVRSRLRDRLLKFSTPVAVVCALLISLIWFSKDGFDPDLGVPVTTWGIFLLAVGFAALIAATLKPRSLAERIASDPTLRFFGRYSYGLYVYHLTIAGIITAPLRPLILQHTGSKFLSVLTPGLLALAISVAVSWVSFTFYEKRFLLLKSRFHDHSRRPKLNEVLA